MTRRIEELDVPLPQLQEQLRELTDRRRQAVAELPPANWRPHLTNPEPPAEETP